MSGDEERDWTQARSLRRAQMGGEEGKYVMSVAVGMTGIEAHRIRRYETAGLLCPCRTGGGQRLFSDDDIVVIREIAGLEEQGVNLSGIRLILEMKKNESGGPSTEN